MFGVHHFDTDDSIHYFLEAVAVIFESVTFKLITECICLGSRRESVLRRMPHDLTNDISASAQAMVWCCDAPKHYQSQRRSRSMSPDMVLSGHNELNKKYMT